jgi:hypothetical protein
MVSTTNDMNPISYAIGSLVTMLIMLIYRK